MRIALALPRHPLLRALLLASGAVILVGLLFFGLIAGLVMAAFAALVLLVRGLLPRKRVQARREDIIEGEFRVVDSRPRARIG